MPKEIQAETEEDIEKEAYNYWIELWAYHGCAPTAGDCPARYMQQGWKRSAYIRGWAKAIRHNRGEK